MSDDEPDADAAPQPVHRAVQQRRRMREVGQRPGEVRLRVRRQRRPLHDARRLPRRALLQRRRLHARRGDQLRVLRASRRRPTDQGTCSRLCPGGTGACTPRGGFGHVCLPFTVRRDGTLEARLLPRLLRPPLHRRRPTASATCRCAGASDTSPKICTALCQTDEDCGDQPLDRRQPVRLRRIDLRVAASQRGRVSGRQLVPVTSCSGGTCQ